MYMTFRQMQADVAHMQDALALATFARDRLNSEHGGHYGVSVNIGGDPSAISLASPWATLGEYERVRAAIASDDQLQMVIRMAAGYTSNMQDSIAQILKAPGDRGTYAQVNTVMMFMPAVADAIAFALEVAEFVDQKIDQNVGVLTAVTGNRAGLMWLGYSDSLDELAENGQTLETDPDYLAFFKSSEDKFVPGTLEQSIWQILT